MHIPIDVVIGLVAVLIVGGVLYLGFVQNRKAVDAEADFFKEHEELMKKAEENTKRLKSLMGPDDGDDKPPHLKPPLPPPPS